METSGDDAPACAARCSPLLPLLAPLCTALLCTPHLATQQQPSCLLLPPRPAARSVQRRKQLLQRQPQGSLPYPVARKQQVEGSQALCQRRMRSRRRRRKSKLSALHRRRRNETNRQPLAVDSSSSQMEPSTVRAIDESALHDPLKLRCKWLTVFCR